jgi:hypothetical protein
MQMLLRAGTCRLLRLPDPPAPQTKMPEDLSCLPAFFEDSETTPRLGEARKIQAGN